VRAFREGSGNAGMVARELPPDEVLASWQHVDQRARDLRAAGVPGTLQELRVRAYLDLLQERDTRTAQASPEDTHPDNTGGPRTLKFSAVIRGPCDHAQAQAGYRPGRALRHLVSARNATCTAPGCGQPAARCDLDHTTPWHHGGLTCPCNLAPLCRHHHRVKHAQGWWLVMPEPGVLRWRTPAGRTHTTTPTVYPI
jgi:hypothetical protein